MTLPPLAFEIRGRDHSGPAFQSARRNLADTRRAANRLDADIRRATRSLGGLGKSALIGATGLASFGAALFKMQQGLAQFDRIAKVARQNGLDGGFYQTLAFMAGEASVDVGVLDSALRKFTISIGEAKGGSGALYTELKRLDPELLRLILNTQSAEDRLRLYADAVARTAAAEDKAALVKAGFGQRGADLVRVLEQGARAMDISAEKARRLGNIIEDQVHDQAEEMQNRLGNAADALDKQLNAALISASPLLVNFYENMAAVVKMSREWSGLLDELPGKLSSLGNSEIFQRLERFLDDLGLMDREGLAAIEGRLNEESGVTHPGFRTGSTFGGPNDRISGAFGQFPNDLPTGVSPKVDFQAWNSLFEALENEEKLLGKVAAAGRTVNGVRQSSAHSLKETSAAALDLTRHLDQADAAGQALAGVLSQAGSGLVRDLMRGRDALEAFKHAALQAGEQFVQMQFQALMFGRVLNGAAGGSGRRPAGLSGLLSGLVQRFGPGADPGGLAQHFAGFYANGGVLGAGQWGIAGENGPEPIVGPARIVPTREAFSGPQITNIVHVTIQTPNVESFRRSETQIAGQIVDAVKRGQRGR